MRGIQEELEEIIVNKRIRPVFQPIVSLRDGSVIGYEALSRIMGDSIITNPEELFCMAEVYNKVWELEQLCRKKTLKAVFCDKEKQFDKKLFLNVNPLVMHDVKFQVGFTKEYLERYGIQPSQVVIEITERGVIKDSKSFQEAVAHYKKQQYEIAIDDAGSCYAGLNLICDVVPSYLKLDMNLIRDIHKQPIRYAMVKSMAELCKVTGIILIAEGIETKEELKTLIDIGVNCGQGYMFGKPETERIEPNKQSISLIKKYNECKINANSYGVQNYYIKHICEECTMITPDMRVEQVTGMFEKDAGIDNVCILQGKKVVGTLTRKKLKERLSGRYGFSLNQKKEVMSIMDNEFLEVDYEMPISVVSVMAMNRKEEHLYDFIVVSKKGEYYGIVTVKNLLQKATEIAVNTARLQNPLTGLSGNIVIEREIDHVIHKKSKYTVVYFDLDNFKAFNDVYGFEKGDLIIKEFANILKENINQNDFIGHIGGDDFVAIFPYWETDNICRAIKNKFAARAKTYYSEEDRAQGYIESFNRKGEKERFPLVTVTVARENNELKDYTSLYEITEALAAKKKKEKMRA